MDGLLWELFSSSIIVQLVILAPILVPGVAVLSIAMWRLLQRKGGRRFVGTALLITLGAYFSFGLMLLSLPLTNTSYGNPQPVAIVFGALWLILLDGWLILGLYVLGHSNRLRPLTIGYGLVQVAALGILFYAFYVEPEWVDVSHTQVALPRMPAGSAPITVALMSDIHMERWTGREDTVMRELDALHPDMIVLAGDYINIDHYEPDAIAALHRFLAGLHAEYGVYASIGGVDSGMVRAAFAGTDVTVLDNTTALRNVNGVPLALVGVSNSADYDPTTADLANIDRIVPDDALKMLIYHRPNLIPEAVARGYDFYFTGHTHGGQIAAPFFGALITFSKYGLKYKAGLYDLGGPADTRMYVTRGLGFEGNNTPRARLFARPEISVITFVPAQ